MSHCLRSLFLADPFLNNGSLYLQKGQNCILIFLYYIVLKTEM